MGDPDKGVIKRERDGKRWTEKMERRKRKKCLGRAVVRVSIECQDVRKEEILLLNDRCPVVLLFMLL